MLTGNLFVYLGQREYISCDGRIDSISGVANVPDIGSKLQGKHVFASLICTFRHGREEDEMMGLSFCKELVHFSKLDKLFPFVEKPEKIKLDVSSISFSRGRLFIRNSFLKRILIY